MDNATQQERNEIRKLVLTQRNALSETARQQKSADILAALTAQEHFKQASTIFTYINFRSEVITSALLEICRSQGKRLCVPLTLKSECRLEAYQLTEHSQLRPGYCGIPEPDPHTCGQIDPQRIELILLPGSVFDRQGGRLGYGGGYYDRFIANDTHQALRIGLAFDLQLVDRLPLLPHDQPLHHLITETQILAFSKETS